MRLSFPLTTSGDRCNRPQITRHDVQMFLVALFLMIPSFFLAAFPSSDKLSDELDSAMYNADQKSELELILSKTQPPQLPCTNPLRRAVPLLISEQKYVTITNKKQQEQIALASSRRSLKQESSRVCVVMTTYNVVDYVGIAMEALLQQTYPNLEIIVVDDNSNDGTTDLLLKKYATFTNKLPSVNIVHLTHNTNGGAGQPSNIGVESCSNNTDYVMFADGDDYIELDAIESMLTYATKYHADVVMADFDVVQEGEGGEMVSESSYDFQHWDEVPTDTPFNILTHPRVLRTSPVPWRKMYSRKMLSNYQVKFPEGDYFYEDNSFHWSSLLAAARCIKIDRVLFHHRRARKGQTSYNFHNGEAGKKHSMTWYKQYTSIAKLGGYFPNLHSIGRRLFPETLDPQPESLSCLPAMAPTAVANTYLNFLAASGWIGRKQMANEMTDKFMRRLDGLRQYWVQQEDIFSPMDYWKPLNESLSFRASKIKKDIDLTIIMPTVNVGDFIYDLLNDMYSKLSVYGFEFEVFAIDDGSTDNTADILRDFADDHKSNFYFLTSNSMGAGKARNLAIPLAEGRYVYFVDADDGFDFLALKQSVDYATKYQHDVLIFPYKIDYVGFAEKKEGNDAMMKSDARIWNELDKLSQDEKTHERQKEAALSLINYPWKQLTSSKLMKDYDVFFGPTRVHNDVQFHWTSIAASRNVHFHDQVVCTHRKFDASVRGQLTEVKDHKRMAVFPALGMTQRALARHDQLESVWSSWKLFSKNLISWAKSRIPKDALEKYKAQTMHFKTILDQPKSPDVTWSYWGDERFLQLPLEESSSRQNVKK
mmetsp:Transcript_27293/g.40291  ORF Transcript_27293/g.40291 Transcript_27293/m.40291 type:complete len:821 (-) Transcript_27293:39-2501(-)|eukprot:CAMPEP_0194213706 /NCGR_PEP_ID=MMETSP0156-20130528/14480_1 /TAXON_ID=33649 /ORGANISM="Thalassionema nitzschioides, Strain L26-B" /LENGTH=820 /DNA_ID=CAMNT_0038941801 /DNA_START=166 /DNA_END=2628 /DNA_ORIENTATION=+